MLLGHLVDLKAKAGGEKSMPEKRETLEGAESAVLQDLRDRAKGVRSQKTVTRKRSEVKVFHQSAAEPR